MQRTPSPLNPHVCSEGSETIYLSIVCVMRGLSTSVLSSKHGAKGKKCHFKSLHCGVVLYDILATYT
jgi:hypothetical protein